MKTIGIVGLGLAAALASLTAHAAFDCSGAVLQALHYADGSVNIQTAYRNDFTVICNTNGTWNGVPGANMPTYWSALVPTYVGLKP